MTDNIGDPRQAAPGPVNRISVRRIVGIAVSVLIVVAILFFFALFAVHRRTPSPADAPTKQGLMLTTGTLSLS
jgi:hypothetical protein